MRRAAAAITVCSAACAAVSVAACKYPALSPVGGDDGGGSDGPFVAAIDPDIASPGDTVTFEGTFPAAVVGTGIPVEFAGGATGTATVLGAHRAHVVVPTGAQTGPIGVGAAAMFGTANVRIATFSLGLERWSGNYDQVDVARTPPALSAPRQFHTAISTGTWLYVLGGTGSGGDAQTVERARINVDSTLGAFAPVAGVQLDAVQHTTVTIGTTVYAIGGAQGSAATAQVQVATIDGSGNLGAFAPAAATLVTARERHASAIIGDHVYVLGGDAGDGTPLASVESAVIHADGSLEPFQTVGGVTLSTPRTDFAVVVADDHLYAIGGSSGATGPLASIESAPIMPDGTLGAFAPEQGALVEPCECRTSARIGDNFYLLGGITTTDGISLDAEVAPIVADSTLGAFAPASALTANRAGAAAIAIGNYLYLIGGDGHIGAPLASIERASLDASGGLGLFSPQSGGAVAAPGVHMAALASGQHVFALGGTTDNGFVADVQDGLFAGVAAGFGAFLPTTNPLTTPRSGASVAVIGANVYVLGGNTAMSFGSIEHAPIGSDGVLGAFGSDAIAETTPRTEAAAAVIGGYLYLFGGAQFVAAGTTYLSDVERAPITGDTLGAFAHYSSLATARSEPGVLVTADAVYIIGGGSGAGAVGSIERAPITGSGLGAFATTFSAADDSSRLTGPLVGGSLYAFGGSTGSTDLEAQLGSDGTLGSFQVIAGAPVVSRSGPNAVWIDNAVYLFGGAYNSSIEQAQAQ